MLSFSTGTIKAFHWDKNALLLQYHFINEDASVIRLRPHFRQKTRAHNIFINVHNLAFNEPFDVLLLKRNSKAQECHHDVDKRQRMT